MGESNNKKTEILSIIAVILIILGAVFYFVAQNYKIPKQGQEKGQTLALPTTTPEQVKNPAEKLPDINPYGARTNPFGETKTNPFKDVYKNPFSK